MENVLAPEPGLIAPGLNPDEGKLAAITKCAHADCQCTVTGDDKYCSDYCAANAGGGSAAGEHEHGCDCGHEECASAW